jgi:ribosomal protein S18 acetylase RimI-like enzyme
MMTRDGVTIRPAGHSDLAFIQNLSKRVFSQYGPYDVILKDWFQSGTTMTCLALTNSSPAGFAMVRLPEGKPYHDRISELVAIAVEPEKQKRGIGDLLMAEVLRVAESLEIASLTLLTAVENKPAQALFRKHGFTPWHVEKGYYEGGQEALMMYRVLS